MERKVPDREFIVRLELQFDGSGVACLLNSLGPLLCPKS